MSKRGSSDGGDDSDYEPQENSKRTRRAPNPAMKNGDPLFSASMGGNHISLQPTPIGGQNINNPHNTSNTNNQNTSNVMSSGLVTQTQLNAHSMNIPSSFGMSNLINGSLEHHHHHSHTMIGSGSIILPSLPHAINVPGMNSNNTNHNHNNNNGQRNSHPTIHDLKDEEDVKLDAITAEDMLMFSDAEQSSRQERQHYDDNDGKSNDFSKVDCRNNYFFSVMNTVIDYMVEKKMPCKQITRLYGICGQYIHSTGKFNEIKAKTISNEYSCANSWTSKVQNIHRENSNVDACNLIIPRETIEGFPKPFEKYFELVDNHSGMRIKSIYVEVYTGFCNIREKMRKQKENAGCSFQKSDFHNKLMRGNTFKKTSRKLVAGGKSSMNSGLSIDGSGVYMNVFDQISHRVQEALDDDWEDNKGSTIRDQQSEMVTPSGIHTATYGQVMNQHMNDSNNSNNNNNINNNVSNMHPISQMIVNSLSHTMGKQPPLSYPLPYPVVPAHNLEGQGSELRPFLSYIPCVMVPVCVTESQYNEIHKHLDMQQNFPSSQEKKSNNSNNNNINHNNNNNNNNNDDQRMAQGALNMLPQGISLSSAQGAMGMTHGNNPNSHNATNNANNNHHVMQNMSNNMNNNINNNMNNNMQAHLMQSILPPLIPVNVSQIPISMNFAGSQGNSQGNQQRGMNISMLPNFPAMMPHMTGPIGNPIVQSGNGMNTQGASDSSELNNIQTD